MSKLEEELLDKLTELIHLTGTFNITQAKKWIRKMRRREKGQTE